MCGIGGYVGEPSGQITARMIGLLAHRGPDGQGHWEDRRFGIGLCHTRLSILDLTGAAAQPMHSPDGRFVLVYNGEVYNFRELRKEFEAKGERFASTGDTEVLLRGMALEGSAFLRRVNGIYAFALWDNGNQELLLARDPLGVKPLYYAESSPGELTFASEIKALFANPMVKAAPQFECLLRHLSFCHASGSETAFAGIRRLDPGTLLRWDLRTKTVNLSSFWRSRFTSSLEDRGASLELLRTAVHNAVARQLVSEVPVGAFFSGGIDSTLIAAIAARENPQRLRSYTISYPSSENVLDRSEEDAPYARRTAQRLGLSHTEIVIKPEVASIWPRLVYHMDEPIADPAAIACYLVSKIAREHQTTVLLTGQGADELFGGYPRYRAMDATALVRYVPGPFRRAAVRVGEALPGGKEGKLGAGIRRMKRVLVSLEKDPDRRFLAYCAGSPDAEVLGILSAEVLSHLKDQLPTDACLRHMNNTGLEGVNRWLERDLAVYLPNHNLLYTDKMSMAAGVEARVPLLDLEIVDLATRMPVEWKIRDGVTKAILRDAARGIVPDEVIDRPKAGFGAPYRKWLRYDLAELWEDLTSEAAVKRRGWFDYKELKRIRSVSQSGRQDLYLLQWAVLTVELWARAFLDGRPAGLA